MGTDVHNFSFSIHHYGLTTYKWSNNSLRQMQVNSIQMQVFACCEVQTCCALLLLNYNTTAKHQWQVFEVKTQSIKLHKTLQHHSQPILYKNEFLH